MLYTIHVQGLADHPNQWFRVSVDYHKIKTGLSAPTTATTPTTSAPPAYNNSGYNGSTNNTMMAVEESQSQSQTPSGSTHDHHSPSDNGSGTSTATTPYSGSTTSIVSPSTPSEGTDHLGGTKGFADVSTGPSGKRLREWSTAAEDGDEGGDGMEA